MNEITEDAELLINHDKTVLWLTLNRPKALNSITSNMVDELTASIVQADRDPEVRVVVLSGEGRAFCAGADLKESAQRSPESGANFVRRIGELTNLIEQCRKPVIASVNGTAVAGGLELVLACDIVVAVESAVLGDMHSKYAMFPGAGSSVRLPRKVGINTAKYLMLTGETPSAREWQTFGLVSRVVADDDLTDSVAALAETLASKSPVGLGSMKQALNDSADQPANIALRYERSLAAVYSHSEDRIEGLAAFREKRAPNFKGR